MAQTANEATRAISEWIASALPGIPVAVQSASDWQSRKGSTIRLLSANPVPTSNGSRQAFSLQLDYLVSLAMDDVVEEHDALCELLFAALDRTDFQILEQHEAMALRREFEVPAGAHLFLSINLQRQKQITRAPAVIRPLVVKTAPVTVIQGIVLGPQDTPLVDVRVELPALNLATLTDFAGRFRLTGGMMPNEAARLVATKNDVRVDVDVRDARPLTIRIPLET